MRHILDFASTPTRHILSRLAPYRAPFSVLRAVSWCLRYHTTASLFWTCVKRRVGAKVKQKNEKVLRSGEKEW